MSSAEALVSAPAHPVPVAAIILAAGKSTRMRSKMPKPLHPVCGLPMTAHIIRACRNAGVERIVVVVGHEADAVKAGLGNEVEYALQENQRGTGDAAKAAEKLLGDWQGTILIIVGDAPLLRTETLTALLAHHHSKNAPATLLTAFLDDPTGYGRIIRNDVGSVARIVEEKDTTPQEKAVKEWFPSFYAFQGQALWQSLAQVTPNNAQKEFYLTDTVGILVNAGKAVEAIPVGDTQEVLGINNRVQLAEAGTILRGRILTDLMLSGVSIPDPANTYIDADVTIGQDTTIYPNTFLHAGTLIGEDCHVGPNCIISDAKIGNRVRIVASQITESVLEDDVKVGPFAHLRPKTHLGQGVKIGDFVETKNAVFGAGAQASHLAYIGDAEVGAKANIGAGTITCNYDGFFKSRTVIGTNAFIGSNSTLVAPLTVGEDAMTAAGSVITQDVPDHALGIGRERTVVKEEWAAQFRARRRAEKEKSTEA